MILPSHRGPIVRAATGVLLALALTVPAWAHPAIPIFGPLQEFDANGNGWLDASEQRAAAGAFTSWADQDGDGRLSENELRHSFTLALAQPGVGRLALWYDANRDGKLNSAEREAAFAAFKSRLMSLR